MSYRTTAADTVKNAPAGAQVNVFTLQNSPTTTSAHAPDVKNEHVKVKVIDIPHATVDKVGGQNGHNAMPRHCLFD